MLPSNLYVGDWRIARMTAFISGVFRLTDSYALPGSPE